MSHMYATRLNAAGAQPVPTLIFHLIPHPTSPQGYFLLRESMLDSVLLARDRFLAPGGALYPSHARMWMAPIRSGQCHQRQAEFQVCVLVWVGWVTWGGEGGRWVGWVVVGCGGFGVPGPSTPAVPAAPPLQNAMEGWAEFCSDMQQFYGVDLECLSDAFRRVSPTRILILVTFPASIAKKHVMQFLWRGPEVPQRCLSDAFR